MLGDRLKSLREKKNMTQKQLADAIFVSPAAISQYENGGAMPTLANLKAIAEYFHVSMSYLLGDKEAIDWEHRLSREFCDGVTMGTVMETLLGIRGDHRRTALNVINALEAYSRSGEGKWYWKK